MSVLKNQLNISEDVISIYREACQYVDMPINQIDERFILYLNEWVNTPNSDFHSLQVNFLINVMLLSQHEVPEFVFNLISKFDSNKRIDIADAFRNILSFRELNVDYANVLSRTLMNDDNKSVLGDINIHKCLMIAYQESLDLAINDERAGITSTQIDEIFIENNWLDELQLINQYRNDSFNTYTTHHAHQSIETYYVGLKREMLALLKSGRDILNYLEVARNVVQFDITYDALMSYNAIELIDLITTKQWNIIQFMVGLRIITVSETNEKLDQAISQLKLIKKR